MTIKHWLFERLVPNRRYPIRLFGELIYIHSGKWADIQLRRKWLVVSWRKNRMYAYIIPDATPNSATWGIGKYYYY